MARLSAAKRAYLRRENKKWPVTLREIPDGAWPDFSMLSIPPVRVLRSRDYLVQVYPERDGAQRMTVSRTMVEGGGWSQGITWDDLQRLKGEAGYGDRWAVEVFPADARVVRACNMRHLWLLPEPPAFAWGGRDGE